MSNSHHILRDFPEEPWKDAELMFRLYEDEGLTYAELSDRFGTTDGTISNWMKKHQADDLRADLDVEIPEGKPYQDPELMETLYVEEGLSQSEISAVLDCGTGTVANWLKRHDIQTRSIAEGVSNSHDGGDIPVFYTIESRGYEAINTSTENAYVHRLAAVAWFGFDAVAGKQVHHVNGIEWDNREENFELLGPREHIGERHEGNIWLDRLRAVEMYDSGASSYDIAPTFNVSPGTIIRWVRDFDPSLVRNHQGEKV